MVDGNEPRGKWKQEREREFYYTTWPSNRVNGKRVMGKGERLARSEEKSQRVEIGESWKFGRRKSLIFVALARNLIVAGGGRRRKSLYTQLVSAK